MTAQLHLNYDDINQLVKVVIHMATGYVPVDFNDRLRHYAGILESVIKEESDIDCVVDLDYRGDYHYNFTFDNEEDMLIFQLRYQGGS